ncbi:hypothetical protein [Lacisediminihabitans profunda]|uniref:Uncharacterized protein n=1 Tax=Lacisediminihabitans profunda TaxID=2594790 RepID=A0A5C8UWA5_9MICO|nr:hypothetical protein [Lacisediminihabitans profunda]TXN31945.1 hypothetical protein FVP33_03210 [Lacisediminihabitans profunda]
MNGDEELGLDKTCFIVSPIGSKLDPVGSPGRNRYEESIFMWENVFEPACIAFGLTPVRADKISSAGEIPEQIFTYLRDADVVIADVSHANPNVMYELGLRHTRPGITLQVGEYNLLPFDVTTIRTIQFNRTESGLIGARDDLVDALRDGLKGGGSPLRVTTIWGESPSASARVAADSEASISPEDDWQDDSQPGSMDILADGETAIEHISEVMTEATALTSQVGEIMTEHTVLVSESDARQGGFAGRLRVARSLSNALSEPAAELESASNAYYEDARSLDAMVDYVVTRILTDEELTGEEKEGLVDFARTVLRLVDAADAGAVGTARFRETVRGLRSFSKDLRPVVQVLDRATSRFLEGLAMMSAWRDRLTQASA